GECNFDNNHWCGWIQDPALPARWDITLDKDHTVAGGGGSLELPTYIYSEGESGAIISPPLTPEYSINACLQFFYQMDGDDIGTLTISIKPKGMDAIPVWSVFGQQGSGWHMGRAELFGKTYDYFHIVLLGTLSINKIESI
ncbi:unnamed protein product, partial [Meganyctiphanes norvegica]